VLMPQLLEADASPVCQAAAAVAGWQLGDIYAATAGAERAVDRATHVRDAALARLSLAGVCQVRGDHARAVQLGREMSDLAGRGDDPLLGTMAHVVQALSCAALGQSDVALREAELSAQVAEQSGSPLASGWAAYAQGEVRLERAPDHSLGYLERARALGRGAGSRLLTGVAGLSLVSLRARTTTDDESLAGFAEIIDHWARAGTAVHQWATLRNLVQVLAQRGADEDAARLHGALTTSPRGAAPQGAEAARLAAEMGRVKTRLGPQRFSELTAEGARWSDTEVVARSSAACRAGADAISPD
jgi:ATP/maltotriose-dependent transcriptional regulator MalT